MSRVLLSQLQENKAKSVNIKGHIINIRNYGKLIFVDLRDVSAEIQCVLKGEVIKDLDLRDQAPVDITGVVKERDEKQKIDKDNGDLEVLVERIEILSISKELPFDIAQELTLRVEFDNRPLTLRNKKNRMIFKFQSILVNSIREFLIENRFFEFQAPKIVGGDAEGGANVFKLNYFDTDAFLATSPQFYKQIMVGALERVFCIGNVFRAEKHSTSRHLNEYTSIDFEMGFIKDHTDVMRVLADMFVYLNEALRTKASKELEYFSADLPKIPNEIPSLKLRETQDILKEEHGIDCIGEPDLSPECEKMICEYALKEYASDFIFITHYPVEKRPLYTYEDVEDKGYTKSFDLLFRGVEIVTGGQRIHEYDALVGKIEERGLNKEVFEFYLQGFKYGMSPHGGCGMGLERVTAKYLDLANTKLANVFPRDRNRIDKLLYE